MLKGNEGNKMKKIYALLLALCLLLGLAACGSAPTSSVPVDAAQASAETQPEAQEPEVQESLRGSIADGIYENGMLNLRITCPEGWIFYDDEQIAQINNMTGELLSSTDVADLLGKNGQFMDMMLANGSGNSVNLILQPKQEQLALYSDEQIFTLSESTFKEQFAAAGIEVSLYEPLTMQVGGQERTVLHMVLAGDPDVNEYQIWYRDSDAYMGILTVAIADGSDVQSILDGITSLS